MYRNRTIDVQLVPDGFTGIDEILGIRIDGRQPIQHAIVGILFLIGIEKHLPSTFPQCIVINHGNRARIVHVRLDGGQGSRGE